MNILLQKQNSANAVVTIAHTGAPDMSVYTRQADILIAAIGKAEAITGDMLKPGCVVIDVGINGFLILPQSPARVSLAMCTFLLPHMLQRQ